MSEDKNKDEWTPDDSQISTIEESSANEKEKKRNLLRLIIDLDELGQSIKYDVPENLNVWNSEEEMSDDYKKMLQLLTVLALFLSKQCNLGPEVDKNMSKRIITTKIILDTFLSNLNITGYSLYGLLYETLQNMYNRISGKRCLRRKLERQSIESNRGDYVT